MAYASVPSGRDGGQQVAAYIADRRGTHEKHRLHALEGRRPRAGSVKSKATTLSGDLSSARPGTPGDSSFGPVRGQAAEHRAADVPGGAGHENGCHD